MSVLDRAVEAAKLAAQIQEARQTAEQIHGDRYPAEIEEWKDYVRVVVTKRRCSELEAVVELMESAGTTAHGMTLLMLLAAASDLIQEKKQREQIVTSNVL